MHLLNHDGMLPGDSTTDSAERSEVDCRHCLIEAHPYTKCDGCHLFVDESNAFRDSTPEFPIAQWVHMHRGDEALDGSHGAVPSDETRTLSYWREHGPDAMRERFIAA